MKRKIFALFLVLLSVLIFNGATCSPVSPPAFTPSRSLKVEEKGSFSSNMYGGVASEIFDLSGYGVGVEAGYRIEEDTGLMLNLFGSKGEDDLENNHSLFEGGIGIIKYSKKVNDKSYLLAVEPRIDFSYITNGSISIIPNLVLHSSYRYGFIEPKLTLRGGFSLLISRGDEINVEKEISQSQAYNKAYLKDIFYGGGDLGMLFHIKNIYVGPSVGLMFTKTFSDCKYCSDIWFYYLLNAGINF